MTINAEQLKKECEQFEIELDSVAIDRFDRYAELLIEWNQKINLTAITEPSAIVTRHFSDSLSFFLAARPEDGATLIDVGSGAGFPGLPIKIARNDMDVTLLDGTNKRITFLSEVSKELGLEVATIHARAEEAAADSKLRESFDFATARAVAAMRVLSEYCLGFVKVDGQFIALKGQIGNDELDLSANAIKTMGGRIDRNLALNLADGSTRTLVCVKKISQTPTTYPRRSAKIAKFPL